MLDNAGLHPGWLLMVHNPPTEMPCRCGARIMWERFPTLRPQHGCSHERCAGPGLDRASQRAGRLACVALGSSCLQPIATDQIVIGFTTPASLHTPPAFTVQVAADGGGLPAAGGAPGGRAAAVSRGVWLGLLSEDINRHPPAWCSGCELALHAMRAIKGCVQGSAVLLCMDLRGFARWFRCTQLAGLCTAGVPPGPHQHGGTALPGAAQPGALRSSL